MLVWRKALAKPLGANCCLTRVVPRECQGKMEKAAGIKAGRFVGLRKGETGEVCNGDLALGEPNRRLTSALRDEAADCSV